MCNFSKIYKKGVKKDENVYEESRENKKLTEFFWKVVEINW